MFAKTKQNNQNMFGSLGARDVGVYLTVFILREIHVFRLADLSIEFELEKPPSLEDLLTVIVNREDVENIINRPVSTHSRNINFPCCV